MKKYFLFILLTAVLLLTACSTGDKEKAEGYSGVIGSGAAMGYQYIVVKEGETISWDLRYKREHILLEENSENEKDLEKFMNSVNNSQLELATLVIALSYLLVVVIITSILYKKKRELLKGISIMTIVLASSLACYFAFEAAIKLSRFLHDAKYYYYLLVS
ncbi:hypothetical protein DVB69_11895 [Sporosarcina sp. BI001-red]|uniref:lipoprotein n=1 Tax=Sporosarcina sp. BI001-red TaxID=2282866 RepID=UPI000E280DEA|nr:lipoprotein [Sporosarcina sp. BI001-red]REB06404.1 hypothetical protein DVB69_11895 [Sporosarcina sp. BI001-red]